MVGLFYTIRQEPTETIQQFVIRFQRMHCQLSRAPPEAETKAIFLAALWEPLHTMCTVIDFRTSTVDKVIDRVREMEKSSSWLAMGALQRALPTEENLCFRQAIQCTTCSTQTVLWNHATKSVRADEDRHNTGDQHNIRKQQAANKLARRNGVPGNQSSNRQASDWQGGPKLR